MDTNENVVQSSINNDQNVVKIINNDNQNDVESSDHDNVNVVQHSNNNLNVVQSSSNNDQNVVQSSNNKFNVVQNSNQNVVQISNENQNKVNVAGSKLPEKEKKKGMRPQLKIGLFMGFGVFGVLFGALAMIFWPPIFMAQLRNMLVLTNVSQSFEIWRELPIPMYLECYLWNITNVPELLAGKNATVKVEQIGPYVFRETHQKVEIEWNDNNTVTYYNQRSWNYEPEMSNGSLSDMIVSINPIVATISYLVRNQHVAVRVAVDVLMRMYHEDLFIKANVSSWLFDGIEDPVLEVVSHFPDFPIRIPYDKFGWFYERNNSKEYDGIFVINTGAADFSQLGMVEMWRNSNTTVYRDECGAVRGSTGELWAPELGQPEVQVFAPDICTYMSLSKNRSVVVENIQGVEYAANYSLFDNGHHYPSMACYCDEVRDENCLPTGALNVSICRYGAPAFVSLPHFLHTDPYYPSKIQGLAPTDEHNFRLSLEMFTGMPLSVDAQLQVNLLVRHIHGVTINNHLPDADTLVPMFWFRQSVRITPEYAALARFALNVRYRVPYAFYAITAIGIGLLIAGIVILVRKLTKSPDTTPILAEAESQEDFTQ